MGLGMGARLGMLIEPQKLGRSIQSELNTDETNLRRLKLKRTIREVHFLSQPARIGKQSNPFGVAAVDQSETVLPECG
jgi:hypothetical protein